MLFLVNILENVISSQYSVGTSNSLDQLINSGVVHPSGVRIVPFIGSTVSGLGDYQWKSSFDSCPALLPLKQNKN